MNMHGWNRKPGESSQMEPLIYIRVQVGEKSAFLTNGAGISICKRMRWDIYITPDIKSKWIKDLTQDLKLKKNLYKSSGQGSFIKKILATIL